MRDKKGVVLVGHGGVPRDYPRDRLRRLRELESARKARGIEEPGVEERKLDREVRTWPRHPGTDPYKAGLEELAVELAPLLGETRLAVAYNEFCAPSVDEAVERLEGNGVRDITLISSMVTPGGSHSERDIPAVVERLGRRHPHLRIRYAWPYDLRRLALMLADHLNHFSVEEPCPR